MILNYKPQQLNPAEIEQATGIKVKSVRTSLVDGISIETDETLTNDEVQRVDVLLQGHKREGVKPEPDPLITAKVEWASATTQAQKLAVIAKVLKLEG